MTDFPLAVSVDDAADLIGIGRSPMYELIEGGEIAVLKLGTRTLIRVAELERFLLAKQDAETARRSEFRRLVRAK